MVDFGIAPGSKDDTFPDDNNLGVLVIKLLWCLSPIGETDSFIIISGATRLIGMTARIGADDRLEIDSFTRIFKFRAGGGAVGFLIIPYDDFSFCGDSFAGVKDSNDLRLIVGLADVDVDDIDGVCAVDG